MQRPKSDPLEIQVSKMLDEFGIRNIPIPVDRVAKMLGARIRFFPLDEELSGLIHIKDGVPIIGVNILHHPNRQRFTIAHEIGHLQLHRHYITTAIHVDKQFAEPVLRRDGSSATGTERVEIEANRFAAALLVPKDTLLEMLRVSPIDIEEERGLEDMSKKFQVSKATLQYRIRNLVWREM